MSPKQVTNRDAVKFIDIAAGKRHSLLVTDEGLVYSCGDGRYDQLGGRKLKADLITMRRFPKRVLPSGAYKKSMDLKIVQVQVGRNKDG